MGFRHFDKISKICYGKYIEGIKFISLNDDVFEDHFPGFPVYPGSLIIEALAQLSGAYFEIMLGREEIKNKRCVLSIVKKMKFRQGIFPGDLVNLEIESRSFSDEFGVAYGKALVNNEVRAEGELTFMFIELENEKLLQSRKELFEIVSKDMVVVDEDNL